MMKHLLKSFSVGSPLFIWFVIALCVIILLAVSFVILNDSKKMDDITAYEHSFSLEDQYLIKNIQFLEAQAQALIIFSIGLGIGLALHGFTLISVHK